MATELETRLMDITEVFARGDIERALAQMAELEVSCQTDPERSQILARYATFFHLLELRDEELSALAQALVLDPTNARANYLKAIHLMIDEQWDDAITALNTAARYYPVDDHVHLAEVYGNLSYCWGELGDADRAAMYEEICADLDPAGVEGIEGEEGAIWPEEFEVELEPAMLEDPAESEGDTDEGADSVQETLERMMRDLGKKARDPSDRPSRPRRKRKKRAGEDIRETRPGPTLSQDTLDSGSPPEKEAGGEDKKPRDVRPSPGRRPAGRKKRHQARVRR